MTTLNLTFAAPAPVTLTDGGSLTLTFPAPQAVALSAVGIQGPSSGGGGGVTDGDKGDITVSGTGATWTIDAGTVTLSKMADFATSTILGRATAGTGAPEALTAAQVRAILNVANGATANQTDAFLLSRANHTGTQAAATITGLAAVATSGSAADLSAGTLPAARFDDAAHGSRAGGALHTAATTGVAGFMSATDKSKLDGVAAGATANATDAALRDRATHTGTQAAATITGLSAVATSGSAADLATGLLPAARFDDTAHGARAGGTLHANVIAGGAAGFMTGADKTKLDGVATGATANAPDAALRDRATHTGTQLAATISDFAAAVAATAAVTANTAKVTNATHTGDVTGATALTIAANAVDNTKAADMATARIKGRVTASTGDPEDLTGTQATTLLDVFTTSLKGLAPASGGGTTNFLRADGTWAAAGGGSPITVQDEGSNITTALGTLNFVGAGVTVTGGAAATVTIPGGGGGSVLSGNATLTLSTDRYEHEETVTATGVTGTNRISVWLDPATDADENVPEMTDIMTLAAAPGTDQITVSAAFDIPHSGPLKIQWSAF